MKKLANALDVIGWIMFALGVIVGVFMTSGVKGFGEIFARLALGVIPGVLILLFCQVHKHYLAVAEKLNMYLDRQLMAQGFQPPIPTYMPQAPQSAPRQMPQQPIQQSQQVPQQPQQAPQQPQQ